MSQYNLTKKQHDFLKSLIDAIEKGILNEDFQTFNTLGGTSISSPPKKEGYKFLIDESPQPILDVLAAQQIIICTEKSKTNYKYVITQKAYDAAKNN